MHFIFQLDSARVKREQSITLIGWSLLNIVWRWVYLKICCCPVWQEDELAVTVIQWVRRKHTPQKLWLGNIRNHYLLLFKLTSNIWQFEKESVDYSIKVLFKYEVYCFKEDICGAIVRWGATEGPGCSSEEEDEQQRNINQSYHEKPSNYCYTLVTIHIHPLPLFTYSTEYAKNIPKMILFLSLGHYFWWGCVGHWILD